MCYGGCDCARCNPPDEPIVPVKKKCASMKKLDAFEKVACKAVVDKYFSRESTADADIASLKVGDTVVFNDVSDSQVNWAGHDDPRLSLHLGQSYIVKCVDVHNWHTEIELAEIPGKRFNSVHFKHLRDQEVRP